MSPMVKYSVPLLLSVLIARPFTCDQREKDFEVKVLHAVVDEDTFGLLVDSVPEE